MGTVSILLLFLIISIHSHVGGSFGLSSKNTLPTLRQQRKYREQRSYDSSEQCNERRSAYLVSDRPRDRSEGKVSTGLGRRFKLHMVYQRDGGSRGGGGWKGGGRGGGRKNNPVERQQIKHLERLVDEGNFVVFETELKTLAFDNNNVHDYSDSVLPLINRMSELANGRMDPKYVSTFLWSLSRLGFNPNRIEEQRELVYELIRQICMSDNISGKEITTALGGLTRMRMKWRFMPTSLADDLMRVIAKTSSSLNDREVSNLLHALGKQQLSWQQLPQDVRDGLSSSLAKMTDGTNFQQSSMTVYSLGVLGFSQDDFRRNPELLDTVLQMAESVTLTCRTRGQFSYVPQQMANIIYGLGKLGFLWRTLPESIQSGIQEVLERALPDMNDQEVANTVYSLGVMSTPWHSLSVLAREEIQLCIAQQVPVMIRQGLSTTVYGLGEMGVSWNTDLSPELRNAIYRSIQKNLSERGHKDSHYQQQHQQKPNGQALANVVYSMGISGAEWSLIPEEVQEAMFEGIAYCAPYFIGRELSSVSYGLGFMKVNYESVPLKMRNALEDAFGNLCKSMNEQEACSTLNGLARMDAKWDTSISPKLQEYICTVLVSVGAMKELCLACSMYSLGQFEASWSSLPKEVIDVLVDAAITSDLRDQSLSNTIYGLGCMKADWAELPASLRDTLIAKLGSPTAFEQDVPQHISNSLWGMGKLGASWLMLPRRTLEASYARRWDLFAPQENANVMYGLAVMNAAWDDLALSTKIALSKGIANTHRRMTVQEVANVMYAIALLSFNSSYDTPYKTLLLQQRAATEPSVPSSSDTNTHAKTVSGRIETGVGSEGGEEGAENGQTVSSSDSSNSALGMRAARAQSPAAQRVVAAMVAKQADFDRKSSIALWSIHVNIMKAFRDIDPARYNRENYDQFAIYFELARAVPNLKALTEEIFGGKVPRVSGPSGNVPSGLHCLFALSMERHLKRIIESNPATRDTLKITQFHEFSGLNGVFPVDIAVFCGEAPNDELIALIEVDGEAYHYNKDSDVLGSKDQVKAFLYKYHYPNVPLMRVRQDNVNWVTVNEVGRGLAQWILQKVLPSSRGLGANQSVGPLNLSVPAEATKNTRTTTARAARATAESRASSGGSAVAAAVAERDAVIDVAQLPEDAPEEAELSISAIEDQHSNVQTAPPPVVAHSTHAAIAAQEVHRENSVDNDGSQSEAGRAQSAKVKIARESGRAKAKAKAKTTTKGVAKRATKGAAKRPSKAKEVVDAVEVSSAPAKVGE